jgi:predicted O-linked N-acetylglucosamine transferase (SPINDLY family)
MRAVPGSRLLLKFGGLDAPAVRARILALLNDGGVEPERVEIRGGTPLREHLAVYGEVDVAFDPMPHGGGVTTLEALWMGVPTVALLGDGVPSRLAGALLHATGLPDLVAATPDAYVEIARRLVADLPGLASQRGLLRDRLRMSPVGSPRLYTAAVEAAYRVMWRDWCAQATGPA